MKRFYLVFSLLALVYSGLLRSQICLAMEVSDHVGNDNVVIDCSYPLSAGRCLGLSTTTPTLRQTTSYRTDPIPFAPYMPFNSGTPLNANFDDLYAQSIDMPFTFCFFGNNFKKLVIGSNGLVTFDVSQLGKVSYPNVEQTNPHPLLPRNSIFGVFQDLVFSSSDDSEIYYSVIQSGACRKLVINFYQGRIAGCQDRSSTQIVLTEFTNEIEIFVENKALPCSTAKFSNALLGIMNADGTRGYSPPQRNTGLWEAEQEAWRFSPEGNIVTPVIEWFTPANVRVGTGATINVCPQQNTTYTAKASYTMCGTEFTLTDSIDVEFSANYPLARDYSKVFCTAAGTTENVNLDDYRQFLTPQNPGDLLFTYHATLEDAQAGINPSPTEIALSGERLFYVRIQNPQNTECFRVSRLMFQFISSVVLTRTVTVCDTNNDGIENGALLSLFNPVLFAPDIAGTITYYLSESNAQNSVNPVTTANLTDGMQLWLRFGTAQCSQVIGPVAVAFTPAPNVNTPVALPITVCDINDNNSEPYDFDLNVSALITSDPNVKITYYSTYEQAFTGTGAQVKTIREGDYFVYVRVEDTGGCLSVAEVRLSVDFNEVEASNKTEYQCFNGTDDITVDLSATMIISPSAGLTITYHTTEADAEEGVSPIDPVQVITEDKDLVAATYFVRFTLSEDCYTVRRIRVVLTHPVSMRSDFTVCDFGNNLSENVNLSQFNSAIAGAQPAAITYFRTQADAANNTGAITILPLTGPQQLFVRIVVNSCVEIYPINLTLVATPVVADEIQVSRSSICDHNNDGGEAYDLTQHQAAIYSGAEPVQFSYFTGYNPASQSFFGPVAYPAAYAAVGNNTVFVRVQFAGTGCYSVSKINLKIDFIPAPVITEATLRICDEQFNFNETFNLNSAVSQMFDPAQNPTLLRDIDVTFYRTQAQANAGVPATAIGSDIRTQQSLVTVYARFRAKATGCYSVKPIHLRTYFPPKAINSSISGICDSDLDGLYEVNLLQYVSQMVDINDPENQFSFFLNLADAQNERNKIANPDRFEAFPLPERIYVKVANLPGCDDISFITLHAGTKLPVLSNGPFALDVCDISNDGTEIINLTQFQNQIYPGAMFEYYSSMEDLNKSLNPISNPGNFAFNRSVNAASFYVKVMLAGFCPVYAVINVNLKKTPQFSLPIYYFCPYNGDSVDIEPDFTGQDLVAYQWTNPRGEVVSTSDRLLNVNITGTYTLLVTAANNCTFTTTFEVRHYEVPVITQLIANGSNYTVMATGSRSILYSIDGQTWQTGNIFYNLPVGQTTFYVKFSGEECLGMPKKGVILNIPNAFTPNDDGYNDVWQVRDLDVFDGANSVVQIFDRQQVLLHQEEAPDRLSWNGRSLGRPVPTDTYWYVLKLPDGRTFFGWIFLRNRD